MRGLRGLSRLNICPYCGAPLIWDYRTGDIVCSGCGSVIDRIYVYSTTQSKGENRCSSGRPGNTRLPRSYKLFVKLSRKIKNKRGDLMIDKNRFSAVMRSGAKPVRLLYSLRDEVSFKSLGEDPVLKEILDRTVRRYPRLASRTIRGKVAAALLIKYLFVEKRHPSQKLFREVAEKSGSSVGHVRRIYAIVRNIGKTSKSRG